MPLRLHGVQSTQDEGSLASTACNSSSTQHSEDYQAAVASDASQHLSDASLAWTKDMEKVYWFFIHSQTSEMLIPFRVDYNEALRLLD